MSFIKRLFKIKRYFLINYNYSCTDNSFGSGSCNVKNDLGGYPNLMELEDFIRDTRVEMGQKMKAIDIYCINEVSKADYTDYFKKIEKIKI